MEDVLQPAEAHKAPDLGIIAALPQEVGGVLGLGQWESVPSRAASRLYSGAVGETSIILSVSGMGRTATEDAAAELLQRFRPRAVLSIGFAGGLAPRIAPGDLVVAEEIVRTNAPDGDALRPDDALQRRALAAMAKAQRPFFRGALLTVSRVISSRMDKARLAEETGALAVDMESAWVARVCRRHETPFLAVRAVVDAAGDALPSVIADVAAIGAGSGRRRARLLTRPWLIPRLLRLALASARARANLTAFVAAFATACAGEPEPSTLGECAR